MLTVRTLGEDDREELQALLAQQPQHNVFHLSALREFGLASRSGSWAAGVFRHGALEGVVMALRGTGGIYWGAQGKGDDEALRALADLALDNVVNGRLSLLSGHYHQLEPLLPLIKPYMYGRMDRCHFTVLLPGGLLPYDSGEPGAFAPGFFTQPRLATGDDMERLIDFYITGFYSLAHIPTREGWRNRLAEQLAFRTLYVISDREGKVASAAQSSAQGGGAAMLGGVATLDSYRGLGLSTWCVGALCSHLFQEGFSSIGLFYLKDNLPAARVYEKLGFRPAGEWLLAPMGLGLAFG